MKKLVVILAIAVLFIALIVHNNSNPKVIISKLLQKGDIRPGELIYSIHLFGVLPIGEAVLGIAREEDYEGCAVLHLHARAQSAKAFSRLFSGSAALDSYLDKESLNPFLFKQKIELSGKPAVYKEVAYDQKEGIMTLAEVRRQIPPGTQDPLSMVFNLRRLDFDKINQFETNINTNQKNYILQGTAENKDISINNQRLRTAFIKADIRRRDKNPYHRSQISMVLLKDKGNTPVLIRVFASGVLINAKLVEIK